MSEDLGHLTDIDLGHLTNEEFERIGAIVEGSVDRQHGEHILAAVAVQEDRRQGRAADPVLEVLRQAHQAEVESREE
jgi:hypothetical protein